MRLNTPNIDFGKPRVSIVMNGYNSETFLKEAIESVYAQTFTDWEIIFWDNASTDTSADIAQSFDDRVKYFYNDKNVCLGAARNLALNECQGEFLAFLDCDDVYLPTFIEKHVANLEKHPNAGFSYCNQVVFDNKREVIAYKTKQIEGNIFSSLLQKYTLSLPTVILRKAKLNCLDHFFDERLMIAEDCDLFLRLAYHEEAFYIPEVLVKYRRHNNCLSRTDSYRVADERRYLINKLASTLPNVKVRYQNEMAAYESATLLIDAMMMIKSGLSGKAKHLLRAHWRASFKYFLLYGLTWLGPFFSMHILRWLKWG